MFSHDFAQRAETNFLIWQNLSSSLPHRLLKHQSPLTDNSPSHEYAQPKGQTTRSNVTPSVKTIYNKSSIGKTSINSLQLLDFYT